MYSINIKKLKDLKNNNDNELQTKTLFDINTYLANMMMVANKDGKGILDTPNMEKDVENLPIQRGRANNNSEFDFLYKHERSLGITSEASHNIFSKSHRKYVSKWTVCKDLMTDYTQNSTVSGLNYTFAVHRPFYERIYWIFVMLVSLYLAITLIRDTYVKWLDSPIVITFDETLVPTKDIPFPTVTICPEIKMETELFDFANVSRLIWSEIEEYKTFENRKNLTDEELQHFTSVLQICDTKVIERFAPYMPKDVTLDVTQTLVDLALIPNTTIWSCRWNSRNYFGDYVFKHVITDEGACYQFNALHSSDIYRDPKFISYSDDREIDFNQFFLTIVEFQKFNEIVGKWSLEKGYEGQGFNSYPQRSVMPATRNSFHTVLLGFEHNFEYTCRSFRKGYKVFLNAPGSVPSISDNYILVPHDFEVLIKILPEYITSTESIRNFVPEKRQCFFEKERYLRFFKTYSKSNCETECLVNFTIAKCGCAKFWMPKPLDIPICNLTKVNCYSNAAEEMNSLIANQTVQKLIDPNVEVMCNCMTSCYSLVYDYEIIRSPLEMLKTVAALRYDFGIPDIRGARLTICFKEAHFTAMKRTVMFGVSTLLANCGGIFGLFMGLSTTSVIEFLYYFSIRLFNNLNKRRNINKKLMKRELHRNINI